MKLRWAAFMYLVLFPILSLIPNPPAYNIKPLQATTTLANKEYELLVSLGHEKLPVQIVQWHPKANRLAVAYRGYSSIEIFDTDAHKLERTLHASLPVPGVAANALSWSPDGKYLAVAFDTEVMLWNMEPTPIEMISLQGKGFETSISWAADSTRLAIVRGSDADRHVTIWDVQDGKQVGSFPSDAEPVSEIAWSPDGKLIAASTSSGDVQLWDAGNYTLSKTIPGLKSGVFLQGPLVWRADSQQLVGVDCTNRGFCRLWIIDVSTGQITLPAKILFVPGPVNALAWTKDSRLLAGDDGVKNVQIFDMVDNILLQTLDKHTDIVLSIAWNFDSTRLATADVDGSVQIWGNQ